ncbi:GyrI-like domain-containing protein [Rhodobacteraceae bacterium]|nr:GyrI-like domain-containing protein [Paracoccaceae bacterium]
MQRARRSACRLAVDCTGTLRPFGALQPDTDGGIMIGQVYIRELEGARLVGLSHRGPYDTLEDTFARLFSFIEERVLWGQVKAVAAVGYDDVRVTAPDQLRAHACVVVADDFPREAPLEELRYPSARYAVMEVSGDYSQLSKAYHRLLEDWLPASGEARRDICPYEVYLNSPEAVEPGELRTEIRLALI